MTIYIRTISNKLLKLTASQIDETFGLVNWLNLEVGDLVFHNNSEDYSVVTEINYELLGVPDHIIILS